MDDSTLLYRPVGQEELNLIRKSGYSTFPPRLPDQPIFYPVLSEEYATQIARAWNAAREGTGSVPRFLARRHYITKHQEHPLARPRLHHNSPFPDHFNPTHTNA